MTLGCMARCSALLAVFAFGTGTGKAEADLSGNYQLTLDGRITATNFTFKRSADNAYSCANSSPCGCDNAVFTPAKMLFEFKSHCQNRGFKWTLTVREDYKVMTGTSEFTGLEPGPAAATNAPTNPVGESRDVAAGKPLAVILTKDE